MQLGIHFAFIQNRVPYQFIKLLATFSLLSLLLVGYTRSGQTVDLVVNQQSFSVQVHRLSVEAVLRQIGLKLRPEDSVWPPLESGLSPVQSIEIALASPVIIDLQNENIYQTIYTHHQTPLEIYQQAGIPLSEADNIYVNDQLWQPTQPIPVILPPTPAKTVGLRTKIDRLRPKPVRMSLHRAIPVHLDDNGQVNTIFTTEQTVGDLLLQQNIPLYLGDTINPDISVPLTADTTISIERSVPVSIQVDGRLIKTRTLPETVTDVLAQEGIALVGQDYTNPPENAQVRTDTEIEVVRQVEILEIDKETSPFETIWVSDPNLQLDVQQIQQPGQEGVTKTRTRVIYQNGQQISRVEEETWLEQEATDKIIAYGTKVVVRTLETPDGTIEYWRKVRMLATAYTAATSGKSRDHPAYGITRTGLQAGFGIVAVDPNVVALRSKLYVPGYGEAVAGDTGGAILGKRIDLGYDDVWPIPVWYTWVDVYLLTPVPPSYQIRYVLPQWPQER